MSYYLLEESIRPCTAQELHAQTGHQYIAVLTSPQWEYERDLYNAQLEVRQNRTMTLLTVITTIFMPLTLIAGWYGMNFRYMPEQEWHYGYLIVFVVSILIVVFCLICFRKKKWL